MHFLLPVFQPQPIEGPVINFCSRGGDHSHQTNKNHVSFLFIRVNLSIYLLICCPKCTQSLVRHFNGCIQEARIAGSPGTMESHKENMAIYGIILSICNSTENITQRLIFFIQVNVVVEIIQFFQEV